MGRYVQIIYATHCLFFLFFFYIDIQKIEMCTGFLWYRCIWSKTYGIQKCAQVQ